MRWLFLLLALLCGSAHAQGTASGVPRCLGPVSAYSPGCSGVYGPGATATAYTGPGDIQSGATLFIGVRGYSGAYAATGTGKAFNIRRASDNATQDIVILTSGALDIASYNTFVGTDATASCTISGTSMACSGASGTIHVGDPVTGAGITNPCIVTVTDGSTTATVSLAEKIVATTCGTVAVAEPVTFQVAGFIPKAYDQSGNGNDLAQAVAGSQLQFHPNCGDGFPCILSKNGEGRFFTAATIASTSLTYMEAVVNRVDIPTAFAQLIAQTDSVLAANANQIDWNSTTPNQIRLFSSSGFTATVNDNSWHGVQGLIAGASPNSIIASDCTQTPGTSATGISYTKINVLSFLANGVSGQNPPNAYLHEAGAWAATPASSVLTSQSHNIRLYYGTPGAC
jgi:hypothetical protein